MEKRKWQFNMSSVYVLRPWKILIDHLGLSKNLKEKHKQTILISYFQDENKPENFKELRNRFDVFLKMTVAPNLIGFA